MSSESQIQEREYHQIRGIESDSGKSRISIGLVITFAVGTLAALYFANLIFASGEPNYLMSSFGVLAMFVAVTTQWHQHQRAKLSRRLNEQKQLHPGDKWLWDYEWDSQGFTYSSKSDNFVTILLAAALLIPGVPMNYMAWTQKSFVYGAIAVVMDLLLLLCLSTLIKTFLHDARGGKSRIAWNQFPLRKGEAIHLHWLHELQRKPEELKISVDLIHEFLADLGNGALITDYEILTSQDLPTTGIAPGSKHELPSFVIPEDSPSTSLSYQDPKLGSHYYLLKISMKQDGATFTGHYLLPVY
ncbi:MAG: hypothetical protein RL095_2113 [Verrucomicrobiota bacterium]|jgi:hypothetical protein